MGDQMVDQTLDLEIVQQTTGCTNRYYYKSNNSKIISVRLKQILITICILLHFIKIYTFQYLTSFDIIT